MSTGAHNLRRPASEVAERQNRAARDVVARRVEAHLEVGVRGAARRPLPARKPLSHVRLLLLRHAEGAAAREDHLLLGRVDPRDDERDVMAHVRERRRTKQSIHSGARLPRQRRGRHDRNTVWLRRCG